MRTIFLIILIVISSLTQATNYYFANSGNDITGAGTIGNPYKTTSKVEALALVGGDTVFFKRGDTFVSTEIMYVEGGTVGNPVVFTAYGTGAKPIITTYGDIPNWRTAGNWTNIGGNVWTFQFGGYYLFNRLWINGVEVSRVPTANDIAVNSTNIWNYHWSDKLYLYSATNPASTFSSMKINTLDKIFYCDYGNIVFSYLDLQASHNCIKIANSADNFIIDSCNIGWNSDGRGINAANSDTTHSIDNVLIRNCNFDSNDEMMYVGYEAQSAFAAIDFKNGGSNWEIESCFFKNWGHSSIDVEVSLIDTGYQSDNISIHDNYFTAPDIYYGRAMGIGGRDGFMSNVVVYNNYSYDCPTPTQINGGATKIYNNIFDNNHRESLIIAKPYSTGAAFSVSNSDYNVSVSGMEIFNNVFANAYDAGFDFGGYDGSPDMEGLIFANNILYDNASSTRSSDYQLYIYDQVSMKGNVFKNNLFYKEGVTDVIYYGNSSTNDYPHTVSEFNAEIGTDGDEMVYNIFGNPLFVSSTDFHLQSNSPAIDVGDNTINTTEGESPDIGAFEYIPHNKYYFASSGDDTTGIGTILNPYKSITKCNELWNDAVFFQGDSIFFKRGDTFNGTLLISEGGTSSNNITVAAYGTGAKPIISGTTSITGWSAEGGTTYVKYGLTLEGTLTFILIDNKWYPMSRYPDYGTDLIYETHGGLTTIIDNENMSSSINWTGANIFIRKNEFVGGRGVITNHFSNAITFTNLSDSQEPTDESYYFIQNDLRAMSLFGEWTCAAGSPSNFYVRLPSTPDHYDLQVPVIEKLVDIQNDHISMNNIHLKGCTGNAVSVTGEYANIQSCDIEFAGLDGINLNSLGATVNNCRITNIGQTGIWALKPNITITNNTLRNISSIEGIGLTSSYGIGINVSDTNTLVQYNSIDSVGAMGISFTGHNTQIRNNIVSNYQLNMNDGGGIYTGEGIVLGQGPLSSKRRVIDGNIVLNGRGKEGKPGIGMYVLGIYLDAYSSNIVVSNNSVANAPIEGISVQVAHDVTLTGNTVYDCLTSLKLNEWDAQNSIYNIPMKRNIWASSDGNSIPFAYASNQGDIDATITGDSNYYCRSTLSAVVSTYEEIILSNTWTNRTLANWQAYKGQDANSHEVLLPSEDNILFVYNASKTTEVRQLMHKYTGIDGVIYNGSVVLAPYTSKILMLSGEITRPYSFIQHNGKRVVNNGFLKY